MRRLLLALLLTAGFAAAAEIPYLSGRVVDEAELLAPETRSHITHLLRTHESHTGNQIAVLTVRTIEGEPIEDYAVAVFEAWKLGSREQDNGVLLVVVPDDRRMRIEVGYGLEQTLTDAHASRIIRNVITPHFRAGDYDRGIAEGVRGIVSVLEGGWVPPEDLPGETQRSGFHFEAPDMPLGERILIGAFVFGIIGLFTLIGLATPGGTGWFLYLFLIPFWSMFPMVIFGSAAALKIFVAYAIAYPFAKLFLRRSQWYRKAQEDLRQKGRASIGGFTIGGGSRSWSSGGGFSGGGGRSGGGGASGSW
ncbi:MAG: TPM domain-containing protein [Burkholderiales bacterium]